MDDEKNDFWPAAHPGWNGLFLILFYSAATHPWDYNGIDGLWGSFLGTGMLFPFILAMAVMCGGLVICYLEAYPKNK